MKKLILIPLAAALLAFPAVAAAKHHPRPTKHVKAVTLATAKNSAFACKALRAQDATLFAKTFGRNHNGRNAFGTCVSLHAHARHTRPFTVTLHGITVASTGTVTSAGAAGCNTSPSGCTVTSAGTLTGILGGAYTSSWNIDWTRATSNGAGGYCAPATGSTTLTVPVLGTLTKAEQGTVCEVGATGANVEHTLSGGTFAVSSGTGPLTGATGSGTVSFDQKPGATSALGGSVAGSETFDTLTLSF